MPPAGCSVNGREEAREEEDWLTLQRQYDRIYSYFKTTCEPFDFIEWDGKSLLVWRDEAPIERYSLVDLGKLIPLWVEPRAG